MLRSEQAATPLKGVGEVISDSLLIAMILKGLPKAFNAFSIVITQKNKKQTFLEFTGTLRSYEE